MDFLGKRTLIMGLRVNGSGIASARYAAQHSALVRVTDLRSAELLALSIRSLVFPLFYSPVRISKKPREFQLRRRFTTSIPTTASIDLRLKAAGLPLVREE